VPREPPHKEEATLGEPLRGEKGRARGKTGPRTRVLGARPGWDRSRRGEVAPEEISGGGS